MSYKDFSWKALLDYVKVGFPILHELILCSALNANAISKRHKAAVFKIITIFPVCISCISRKLQPSLLYHLYIQEVATFPVSSVATFSFTSFVYTGSCKNSFYISKDARVTTSPIISVIETGSCNLPCNIRSKYHLKIILLIV